MSKTCCQAKVFILIFLMNLAGCSAQVDAYVSKLQGQEATLTFFYPCDSNEITLQQSIQTPFYRSTDNLSLSLHGSQVGRFRVQNRNDDGRCSLELTICDLKRYDQGTYIVFVYKDGLVLNNAIKKIHLYVDYPPGKATCVVGEEKGRGWVSIDCTASAGSLPGAIECYQNGVWIHPYPTEIDAPLNQTFLIRKAQSTFCCSFSFGEYKERCQCNDTSLYLSDGDINDPCPTPVEMTTEQTTVIQYNQSNEHSTSTASIPTEKYRNTDQVKIWSLYIFIAFLLQLLLLGFFLLSLYCTKKNTKRHACEYFSNILCNAGNQNEKNHPDPEGPCGMEQTESFI
ncbi:uncharacterized protein LOC129270619 [Lytechinus pictus]|uniref:uncharacterized protein LOC129270619 n=1 Tax=Lytechinus pictus TaxID=7653 RepID=UPI0030B9F89A